MELVVDNFTPMDSNSFVCMCVDDSRDHYKSMKKSSFGSAQLIADALINLKKHGVDVKLSHSSRVRAEDGSYCKGYWEDHDPNKLVFACSVQGNPENWIGTFAHEYCHFLQWIDKIDVWHRYNNLDGDILMNCISNKPVTNEDLNYYLETVRDIELDCEKRTVKLLKSYDIDLDYDEYIRGANIYIFYYTYLKTSRRWNNSSATSIYEIPEIRALVQPKFYRSYSKIPPNILKKFIKYEPPVKKSRIISE